MKTIEIKLYRYDELSEEAKKKAIEQNRYVEVQYDWWNEDECWSYVEKLDDNPFAWKSVNFDLDRLWYIQFHKLQLSNKDFKKLFNPPEALEHEYAFDHYLIGRERSTYIWFPYLVDERYDAEVERIQKEFDELMENFLQRLTKEYEYRISDKMVESWIQHNEEFSDLWFSEDGTEWRD